MVMVMHRPQLLQEMIHVKVLFRVSSARRDFVGWHRRNGHPIKWGIIKAKVINGVMIPLCIGVMPDVILVSQRPGNGGRPYRPTTSKNFSKMIQPNTNGS